MRKNILVLVLLLCGMFSLAAQSRTSAPIYVLPVTGTGSTPEDNSIFYNQLIFELTDQYYNVAKTPDSADFFLIGTLNPCTDEGQEGLFAFHLELRDKKAGDSSVEGDLLYETPEDIDSLFPVMVSTLLYTIPEDPVKQPVVSGIDDAWRNKLLYVGASAIVSPRLYKGVEKSIVNNPFNLSLGGGISAEFHILDFLSLEAGLELATDVIKINNVEYGTNKEPLFELEIPILIKGVLKPSSLFMIEPYVGAQLYIPLSTDTNPTKPSWPTFLAGLQYGVKAGPGVFFIDARVGIDFFGNSEINTTSGTNPTYKRTIIHLGFGYKFGIFQRK